MGDYIQGSHTIMDFDWSDPPLMRRVPPTIREIENRSRPAWPAIILTPPALPVNSRHLLSGQNSLPGAASSACTVRRERDPRDCSRQMTEEEDYYYHRKLSQWTFMERERIAQEHTRTLGVFVLARPGIGKMEPGR